MKPQRRSIRWVRSALVFLVLAASFAGFMQGIRRANGQRERACSDEARQTMQIDPMVGLILAENCACFQSTVEDVPPMMRLY